MDCERVIPTIGLPQARARIMEAGNRAVAERRRVEAERAKIAAIRAEARQRALDEQRVREIAKSEAIKAEARRLGTHPATRIIREVAEKHGLTPADLKGQDRRAKFVLARQEAYYRIAKETDATMPDIGRRIGGRDHTTVLWGIRRHEARLRAEAQS